jgi:hypothetical protein
MTKPEHWDTRAQPTPLGPPHTSPRASPPPPHRRPSTPRLPTISRTRKGRRLGRAGGVAAGRRNTTALRFRESGRRELSVNEELKERDGGRDWAWCGVLPTAYRTGTRTGTGTKTMDERRRST